MGESLTKYKFEKSISIKSAVEKIFEFHLDTNNLPIISPGFPRPEIKSISDIPLREGSHVSLILNFLLFTTEWKIKIEEVIINKRIVDLQESGFFEYWRHSHIFEAEGDEVVMTDRVEFIPPLGSFGKLLVPFFKLQIRIMFYLRHRKTKQFFEK